MTAAMDKNHTDYKTAMRMGAYLIQSIKAGVAPFDSTKDATQFMQDYARIMARGLQTSPGQFTVDIKDEWNKTYGGKKAIT